MYNEFDAEFEADQEAALNELILGATAHLLAAMGDEQASLLLQDVHQLTLNWEPRGEMEETPWVGGLEPAREWVAYLEVEPYLVPRFTNEVLGRIHPVLADVAARRGARHVPQHLETRWAIPHVDEKWRERRSGADQLSNQARRERTAPDNHVADGLRFSNSQELAVYQSLVRLQQGTPEETTFAIAPLPGVRIRAGNTWTPDFLIIGNGRAMLIEVDGPDHEKPHRRADDDMRDHQWRRCRLDVRRVNVELTRPERVDELDAYLREVIRDALWRPH